MKIILIIVFFGKAPYWIEFFLESCKYNPNITWLLYGDINFDFELPENIKRIHASLSDFNKLATSKLEFKVNLSIPYKLCDYKPTYGKIFSEYIAEYDFWGYCDLDIIFGSIKSFISEDQMKTFDVITTERDFMGGHFTLYKNHVELYKKIWRVERYLKNYNYYYYLDEKSNYIGDDLLKKIIKSKIVLFFHKAIRSIRFRFWKILPIKYDISKVIQDEEKRGNMKLLRLNCIRHINYFPIQGINNWQMNWEMGILKDNNDNTEIMYFHFLDTKWDQNIRISIERKNSMEFYIKGRSNSYS